MASKNGIPKIRGSTAGFIALVAVLSVFILVSSIAVVYLARSRSPDERRRQRLRELGSRGPSTGHLRNVTSASATSALREKLANMFAFTRRGNSEHWARAEGDEWDAADEELGLHGGMYQVTSNSTTRPSMSREASSPPPPRAYDPHSIRRQDRYSPVPGPSPPSSPPPRSPPSTSFSRSFMITSRPPVLPPSPPLEGFDVAFPIYANMTELSLSREARVTASESTTGSTAGPSMAVRMLKADRRMSSTRDSPGPSDSVYTFESGSRFREAL